MARKERKISNTIFLILKTFIFDTCSNIVIIVGIIIIICICQVNLGQSVGYKAYSGSCEEPSGMIITS